MNDKKMTALRKEVKRMTHERDCAEINYEETEEVSAELFELCCAVVDGKPNAAEARDKLREHIEHVQSCRRGSCATELGQTKSARVAELEEIIRRAMAVLGPKS